MMKNFSMSSFVAGVMLGALFAGAWFLGGDFALTPGASSSGVVADGQTSLQASGTISVADQPAGDTVTLESVTVPPPGVWAAVREVSGSDLGNVLGAVRVGGPRTSVSIPLLRATESGRIYVVQLYRDDNNGAFDPSANSVFVDFETGARVVARFTTTD